MKKRVLLAAIMMTFTAGAMAANEVGAIEGLPPSPYDQAAAAGAATAVAGEAAPAAGAISLPLPDGSTAEAQLSPHEQALIKAKRDVIIQYLYESKELSGLRDVLQSAEHETAVKSKLREQVPLSPEEIRMVRQALDDAAKAENAPLKNPKLQMRTVDLDIDGQAPLEVHVARGYSSSIVFFDETGAPWPLQTGVDALGDSTAFSAKTVSEQGHVATFQILKSFAQSNALVVLDGLPVPVVLRLVGSDDKVDSRLSVRVPRMGPNAQVRAVFRDEIDNAPADMMAFLNGERMADAVPYQLKGVPGEVLMRKGQLFLRTRANLMSPAPLRSLVSATGYNVYTLPPVTHLLFSVDGEMREAQIDRMYQATLGDPENIFDNPEAE